MIDRNNKVIIEIITALTNEFAEEIRVTDVVALFEDMLKHFHKNELDLVQLDSLNHDQKTELYTEIKTLITLMRALKSNSENQAITHTLTRKLIEALSVKARAKRHHLSKEELEVKIKKEQKAIFEKLENINQHNMHKDKYKVRKLQHTSLQRKK
jgi:hypothetical protein